VTDPDADSGGCCPRVLPFFVVAAVVLLTAGCLSGGPSSPSNASEDVGPTSDSPSTAHAEPTKIVDIHNDEGAKEADVACLAGGAPSLPRESGAYVAAGTSQLRVEVSLALTYTSTQVGYALDSNAADHADDNNRSITWLPQVGPGEEATFTVNVSSDQLEEPGENRWTFYQRMQPPGVDDVCYTGGGMGEKDTVIEAVP